MTVLFSLIGEQTVPILLVDRFLRPQEHWLLHTAFSQPYAQRLQRVLPHSRLVEVPDYALEELRRLLREQVTRVPQAILNLTSGTKPMSWAAYEVAREFRIPFVYLRTQGPHDRLYTFTWQGDTLMQNETTLPALITLEDYLQVHGLPRPKKEGLIQNSQEKALRDFFCNRVDECRWGLQFPAFEIDFLLRRRNRVAVVEAKDERASRRRRRRYGLDQLTTIAGREHLGIYTGKIWVLSRPLGSRALRDLAAAYRVQVVVVALDANGQLTAESEKSLEQALDTVLGP